MDIATVVGLVAGLTTIFAVLIMDGGSPAQHVMENAQRLGDLSIFLNPRDANLLDPSWKEYQLLIRGNKVRIIPSEKITPGGCLIKGNTGTVDARVETQLAAIMNTFDEMEMAER